MLVHTLPTLSVDIMAVCTYIHAMYPSAEKLFHPFLNTQSQYSAFSMFSLVDSHAEIES